MTGNVEFALDLEVRHYELDTQGHVNSANYLRYAEHARWRHLESLGIGPDALAARGVGPVFLELTIKYHGELVAGNIVTVTSEFVFAEAASKTFCIDQEIRKSDGSVAASLRNTAGLLDLATRRLIDDPRAVLDELGQPKSSAGAPKNDPAKDVNSARNSP